MSWPRPLPLPRPQPLRAPWTALREGELRSRCAARWSRLLEQPVVLGAVSGPALRPAPSAWSTWQLADGSVGWLSVDRALLGQLIALLVKTPPVDGPVPLSPAEEGIFAYLAAAWLAELPGVPALAAVHGGDPDWPTPEATGARLAWSVEVGAARGRVVWWLPSAPGGAPDPARLAAVPVPLTVAAEARLALACPLAPGDRLPVCQPPRLTAGGRTLHGVQARAGRLWLTPVEEWMNPPALEALPVPLSLQLGRLTLTAGAVAALRPGDSLPVSVDDPPVITVLAGDVAIARGILVAEGATRERLAVQITEVLLEAPAQA